MLPSFTTVPVNLAVCGDMTQAGPVSEFRIELRERNLTCLWLELLYVNLEAAELTSLKGGVCFQKDRDRRREIFVD